MSPPDATCEYADASDLPTTTAERAKREVHAGTAAVRAPAKAEPAQMSSTLCVGSTTNRLNVKADRTPPNRPLMPTARAK